MLQTYYAIVISSDVSDTRARMCVCMCVVHWHCTAQLSMINMEKRFRNKIIITIIIIICSDANSAILHLFSFD